MTTEERLWQFVGDVTLLLTSYPENEMGDEIEQLLDLLYQEIEL